jgi:hypothetical protein
VALILTGRGTEQRGGWWQSRLIVDRMKEEATDRRELGDAKDERTAQKGTMFRVFRAESWGQERAGDHGKGGATGRRRTKTKSEVGGVVVISGK